MKTAATVAGLVVAALHAGFLVLEMFLWSTPIGRRVFGLPAEVMKAAAPLAANQGLYNGFLAAGLVWASILGDAGDAIRIFFLSCVVIAGVFGGFTAKRSILLIQALPGAIALALAIAAR